MGIPPNEVPERMRRMMPQTERMAQNLPTQADADAKWARGKEKELQEQIAALLRQRNLFFICARMDRKHTLENGTPDFIIVLPAEGDAMQIYNLPTVLMVEVKVEGGELSEDQWNLHLDYARKTCRPVRVVWNLIQFKSLLDEFHP